jgi:hypothetical protein
MPTSDVVDAMATPEIAAAEDVTAPAQDLRAAFLESYGAEFGFSPPAAPIELPSSPELEFSWADDEELQRRIQAFAATVPDYFATIERSGHWGVPSHVVGYIRSSRRGPEVVYHLAKNPDIAALIGRASRAGGIALLLALERQLRQRAVFADHPGAQYVIPHSFVPTAREEAVAAQLLCMFTWDVEALSAS